MCQQFKGTTGLQQQWQELPPVEKPLERVTLVLTDMTPGAQGYRFVLTITDHYSRFVKYFPLRNKNTEPVCEAFAHYMSNFGVCRIVLADIVVNNVDNGTVPFTM